MGKRALVQVEKTSEDVQEVADVLDKSSKQWDNEELRKQISALEPHVRASLKNILSHDFRIDRKAEELMRCFPAVQKAEALRDRLSHAIEFSQEQFVKSLKNTFRANGKGFDPKAFHKFVGAFDRPIATPSTSSSSMTSGLFGSVPALSASSGGLFGTAPPLCMTSSSGLFGSAAPSACMTSSSGPFGCASPFAQENLASTVTDMSFEEARWEYYKMKLDEANNIHATEVQGSRQEVQSGDLSEDEDL